MKKRISGPLPQMKTLRRPTSASATSVAKRPTPTAAVGKCTTAPLSISLKIGKTQERSYEVSKGLIGDFIRKLIAV